MKNHTRTHLVNLSHFSPLPSYLPLSHVPSNDPIVTDMGRPPGNGGPAFRFTPSEVAEMEAILLQHDNKLPPRDHFVTLAEKFSNGLERSGKSTVQMKQVMNWFQNKRYALKAKSNKATPKLDVAPLQAVPTMPPAQVSVLQHTPPVSQEVNGNPTINVPQSFAPLSGKGISNVEFEARSARDGAWYDVAAFLSVKNKDTDDPEVLVRFAGLTSEEDEWIKVSKHVRHRSLPCEASECVAVLPGDLILCFQEAPEQALYFDAHVLDAQRLKHDLRDCRCSFLVRYDHDLTEEVVPLRKICRRPETDYRLHIYQALHDLPAAQQKNNVESTPCLVRIGQAETVPVNEKVDITQRKMTTLPSSPAALEKSTGVPEEANNENMTDNSASKASHKADETLDQDVATKKARLSEEKETTEAQTVTSPAIQTVNKEFVLQDPVDSATKHTSKEVTTIVSDDLKPSAVDDGPSDPNNSSNPPGGVVLTCQNQTNGHSKSNPNAGSSGSSEVPVGAQQCF